MSALPILFSPPMVRALLDGGKTQTRRAIAPANTLFNGAPWSKKHGPAFDACRWDKAWVDPGPSPAGNPGPYLKVPHDFDDEELVARVYPRVQPGQLLWVREAWRTSPSADRVAPSKLTEADHRTAFLGYEAGGYASLCGPVRSYDDRPDAVEDKSRLGRLRAGMHLPRWGSRLALEVAAVRIERLQDISEDDALAEGVTAFAEAEDVRMGRPGWSQDGGLSDRDRIGLTCSVYGTLARAYSALWESINGAGAWDRNPWVLAQTLTVHREQVDALIAARAAA